MIKALIEKKKEKAEKDSLESKVSEQASGRERIDYSKVAESISNRRNRKFVNLSFFFRFFFAGG